MTIAQWLFETMEKLGKAGVDAARRDALVLLEDTIGKGRAWVLTHPEYELPETILQTVHRLIERRIRREPLAYIRGKAWFYKRFFAVTPEVMIPRPESEAFIQLLKQYRPKTIIDIGSGSGCLAITTKLEFPQVEVIAIDISPKALKIAEQNATNHKVAIKFLQGSLLSPLSTINHKPQTIVLANLPYVPVGLITSPEIAHEPPEALFSGLDGLDHYRQFWRQVDGLGHKPRHILTEALENQHRTLSQLAGIAGYKLEKTAVLVQLFEKSL